MKAILFHVWCFLLCHSFLSAEEVVGFWKTISDKTGKPESIVAIYEYQGNYYGRLVATYDQDGQIQDTIDQPKNRAPGVEGNPFYSGLDIMWGLRHEGSKYLGGKIMDPEKGRIYDSEMWPKNGLLIVRGKIWVFGANQEWLPASDQDFPAGFQKPDLTQFIPVIPKVKKKQTIQHQRTAHA